MNEKSYYRICRDCGQRIQMRRMPNGEWVAFEGYDTVHTHKGESQPQTTAGRPSSGDNRPTSQKGVLVPKSTTYDDLGFSDIKVPGQLTSPSPHRDAPTTTDNPTVTATSRLTSTPPPKPPVQAPPPPAPHPPVSPLSPKLYLTAQPIDFGNIVAGQSPQKPLAIANVGNATLHAEIVSAAYCLSVAPAKLLCPPGESRQVTLTLFTGNLPQVKAIQPGSPMKITIPYSHDISVRSDGGNALVTLRATVIATRTPVPAPPTSPLSSATPSAPVPPSAKAQLARAAGCTMAALIVLAIVLMVLAIYANGTPNTLTAPTQPTTGQTATATSNSSAPRLPAQALPTQPSTAQATPPTITPTSVPFQMRFCLTPQFDIAQQRCINSRSLFTGIVPRIYVSWTLSPSYAGSMYVRKWFIDGVLFLTTTPSTDEYGFLEVDTRSSLKPGIYTVELYVTDVLVQSGSFTIR